MKKTVADATELSKTVRRHVVQMCHDGKSSHVGSCLSVTDIVACVYSIMKFEPSNPHWSERDFFILSKGHAGAVVYSVLAELGYFSSEKLKEHYQNGSTMSGHVSHVKNPGVEFSTGSLGHGLSVSTGIAHSIKTDGLENRVFCVLSDGEMGEGSNWEALLFAAHHNLDNLTAIIDRNNLQSIKGTEETLALEPLAQKIEAFGWKVLTVDGHDHAKILTALNKKVSGPKMILCKTTKGKGVSFMEGSVKWHYASPDAKELAKALDELV